MSDEHQRRAEPDETVLFDPAATEQIQPDDGPRSSDAGYTEQLPRTPGGGDNATSVMPAATGRDDLWSGRAEVRAPRPGSSGDFAGGGWDDEPPVGREPRARWWSPIAIGIAVLVLVALLGWGVWLIAKSSGSDSGTGTPAASATATTPPTTEATTTPPTTEPTTTQATTEPTGPAEVTVPALKGLSSADARQALDRTGLAYRLRFVTSSDAEPGTVIDCDPAEGQQVPSDTTVTLIIAAAPSSSPTATSTPTTTPPTDTTGQ